MRKPGPAASPAAVIHHIEAPGLRLGVLLEFCRRFSDLDRVPQVTGMGVTTPIEIVMTGKVGVMGSLLDP